MNSLRTLTAAVLMTLLIASSAAAAGPNTEGDWKQTVKLWPTKFANDDTFGYCTIKREDGVEMLGIRVFANMPDHTLLLVQVTTKGGTFDVGTIEMFLGSGSLVLYSGLRPSSAFPLSEVQAVVVRDARNPILTYAWNDAGVSIK